MATLKDHEVREQVVARGRAVRHNAEPTPAEQAAAQGLSVAFATFDGTDAAYVGYLTGVSAEDMRRVGAI